MSSFATAAVLHCHVPVSVVTLRTTACATESESDKFCLNAHHAVKHNVAAILFCVSASARASVCVCVCVCVFDRVSVCVYTCVCV